MFFQLQGEEQEEQYDQEEQKEEEKKEEENVQIISYPMIWKQISQRCFFFILPFSSVHFFLYYYLYFPTLVFPVQTSLCTNSICLLQTLQSNMWHLKNSTTYFLPVRSIWYHSALFDCTQPNQCESDGASIFPQKSWSDYFFLCFLLFILCFFGYLIVNHGGQLLFRNCYPRNYIVVSPYYQHFINYACFYICLCPFLVLFCYSAILTILQCNFGKTVYATGYVIPSSSSSFDDELCWKYQYYFVYNYTRTENSFWSCATVQNTKDRIFNVYNNHLSSCPFSLLFHYICLAFFVLVYFFMFFLFLRFWKKCKSSCRLQ
jgi:hypothetical protein